MVFSLYSQLDVSQTGGNPRIIEATVDLAIFPREDYRQTILNLDTTAEPDAYVDVGKRINYEWGNLVTDSLRFGLDSRVRVKNEFKKVSKSVKFPITNLDRKYFQYLEPTKNIDLTDGIVAKAHEIVSGEDDLYIATYKLAEWVKNNVNYTLNSMTAKAVKPSSWVFRQKEGVCDELTNLFVSFLRSVGVPARFVSGTAYSNTLEDWGNHGWAEVYFPGYGWVPFDVTYGQYGWIDATHLKLADSFDSGDPSVEYNWRSRDIQISTSPLEVRTVLAEKHDKMKPLVSVGLELLENDVDFGSYVPLQVTVKNLNSYYVSTVIYVTKAPGLADNNVKQVLLKPLEVKNIYWLLKIPSNLKKGYLYTSMVTVNSTLGAGDNSILRFADGYKKYSLEKAKERIEVLSERETKLFFSDLVLYCSTDKNFYYSKDKMKISCLLKNQGNTYLKDVNICLGTDCKNVNLKISEERSVEFDLLARRNVVIIAENDDMVKYSKLDIEVIDIPDVYITDLKPLDVDYFDDVNLLVTFSSEFTAYDVNVEIEGIGIFQASKLEGTDTINLPVKGKDLINGLYVKSNFKDKKGKLYQKEERYLITVKNVPLYARLFSWIFRIF